MRRKEKEVTDKKEIEQIFKTAQVCRIAMIDGEKPYIVPMNFGYKDDTLYFHSASSGRKINILNNNPNICFEIDIPGEVIKSKEACSWSMNYRSVIGEGKVEFITDTGEKAEALNIIMSHYSGKSNWEFNSKMLGKTLVFKVEIEKISVKKSS